ncbi:hydrophobic/amphiphilic exporter-1, HAE1 family [Fictibacillus enclensis]|uniref:Multidrug transporter AcrB n=1 Tax=Fictibacillus enclensis TaxID=1017270 RepID=A0A0V8JG42_9BACL|nr:efflux RND transporter permease subunit [Fictibacillus enclensis]KSU85664.1 multidrug transporter AcrB [Fictibacillus enclensis]SCC00550.1 hydrophobic/amphiphilic exporter-1, HAE1 family [Fictibacillus enclensis]
MNWLTKFSLKNPVAIFIFSFLLILGGLFSFSSLKVDLLPNVDFPQITVQTTYPGASPQDVNKQVTDELEEKLKSLNNVKSVKSTSLESVSIINLEFPFSVIMDDIEDQINTITKEADLPDTASVEVNRFSFGTIPIYNISLFPKEEENIQPFVEDELVPELKKIQGINNVSVGGVKEDFVSIKVDQKKAQQLGLSLSTIKDEINYKFLSFPAGNVTSGDISVPVRVEEQLKTIKELKSLDLTPSSQGTAQKSSGQGSGSRAPSAGGPPAGASQSGGGTGAPSGQSAQQVGAGGGAPSGAAAPQSVQLGDIATIKQSEDVNEITRYNQKRSLSMAVTKKQDANTVDVADNVMSVLNKDKYKDKMDYAIGFDQASGIKESVNSLIKEGLFGALFASLAVLLFLRNIRATIIAIVSIPLSILISAIFLNQLDITLNIMTLGGMAVAVGRVVDDSIVVIENIFRKIRKSSGEYGKNELVIDSTKEILRAIVSSTLTTVVVFLPLGFVGGITGEFFLPFALTVVFALLASLLVAITIVPILAKFAFKKVKPENNDGPLQRAYAKVIRSSLNHKFIVLFVSIVLLASSLFLSTKLGAVFLPNEEQKTITANIELPASTTVEKTNDVSLKVEKMLDQRDTVKEVTAGIGSRDFQSGLKRENVANYFINLKKHTNVDKEIKSLKKEIQTIVDEDSKDAVVSLQEAQSGGPPSNNEVNIDLYSNNLDDLQKGAASVEKYMKSRNDLKYVSNNFKDTQRQWIVKIDTKKAADAGVSGYTVLGIINDATKPVSVGNLELNGKESDVRLAYNKAPKSLDEVKDLKVYGTKGPVALSEVTDIKDVEAVTAIQKLDGKVYAQVSAQIPGNDVQGVTQDVIKSINHKVDLPKDVSTEGGGGSEETTQTFKELGLAIAVAIGLVYLTMLITFGRARIPFIILSSLIFVPVGAIGGLYLADEPLSVSAMIGILMLIGIVTTNAIVLVDRIGQNRDLKGMTIREALLEAGKTRLRPILMTAFATIAALFPLALTSSSGTLISKGLAVVVIGGLTTSTLLTLLIVPVLYELFFRKQAKREQRESKA